MSIKQALLQRTTVRKVHGKRTKAPAPHALCDQGKARLHARVALSPPVPSVAYHQPQTAWCSCTDIQGFLQSRAPSRQPHASLLQILHRAPNPVQANTHGDAGGGAKAGHTPSQWHAPPSSQDDAHHVQRMYRLPHHTNESPGDVSQLRRLQADFYTKAGCASARSPCLGDVWTAQTLPLTSANPRLFPRAWSRGHKQAMQRVSLHCSCPNIHMQQRGQQRPHQHARCTCHAGQERRPSQACWGASLTVALGRVQDPSTNLPHLTSTPTLVCTLALDTHP